VWKMCWLRGLENGSGYCVLDMRRYYSGGPVLARTEKQDSIDTAAWSTGRFPLAAGQNYMRSGESVGDGSRGKAIHFRRLAYLEWSSSWRAIAPE
jgi:hypothetical protein